MAEIFRNSVQVINTGVQSDQFQLWKRALQLYLKDPHSRRLLRHVAVRVVPFLAVLDLTDDFYLPVLGWVDDIFWPILIVMLMQMLWKVNGYRKKLIRGEIS